MKLNMLILALTSLAQLVFILWHMFKYRGRAVAISFIIFGLLFGVIRSDIINFVQISANNSLLPYQFRDSLFQIGNDSLQVYVGWIIAAYYAWCLAEMILKKHGKLLKIKNAERSIFAILSIGFIFIASFCYMVETTASYMGWWDWNSSLVAGFESSLFINVPWVGIVDWATVAFEYLGIFLILKYVLQTKRFIYLLILLFPVFHWASHLDFGNFYWIAFGSTITISVIAHLLIPVFAAFAILIQTPSDVKSRDIPYKLVWIALIIGVMTCFVLDIFVGKTIIGLLSLIPISLLMLLASGVNIKTVFKFSFGLIIIGMIVFTDLLTRKRIIMAFFPMAYLAFIFMIFNARDLFHRFDKRIKLLIVFFVIIISLIIGVMFFKFIPDQTLTANNNSLISRSAKDNKKLLFITLDTVRSDHTGVGGYEKDVTPNFDKIADDGKYFSNAYSPIPYTYPAHMVMFTGLYPKTLKIDLNSSVQEIFQPTLPELFKSNGYETAAFVSSSILNKDNVKKGFDLFSLESKSMVNNSSTPQRTSLKTNEQALKWLSSNYEAPFFMWVHFYDAHQPYDTYCDSSYSLGKSPDNSIFKDGVVSTQSPTPTLKDYDFLISRYDEELKCQDEQLGLLINKLRDLKIYDETDIVIVSDHGENFDHGSVFHGQNLYEGSMKVPLMIKMDGFSGRDNTLVTLTDIYPTIVKKFSLIDNFATDGIDLADPRILDRKNIFFETTTLISNNEYAKKNAVLSNWLKLMVDNDNGVMSNHEAYNLDDDKAELNNIWNKETSRLNALLVDLLNFYK